MSIGDRFLPIQRFAPTPDVIALVIVESVGDGVGTCSLDTCVRFRLIRKPGAGALLRLGEAQNSGTVGVGDIVRKSQLLLFVSSLTDEAASAPTAGPPPPIITQVQALHDEAVVWLLANS